MSDSEVKFSLSEGGLGTGGAQSTIPPSRQGVSGPGLERGFRPPGGGVGGVVGGL